MFNQRLDGWKAIAAHLNRSVRQCQRLADSSGLPIHHMPGSRAVFAFPEELDAWIGGEGAPESSGTRAFIGASKRQGMPPVDLAGAGSSGVESIRGPAAEADGWVSPKALSGRRRVMAVFILFVAVSLLSLLAWSFRSDSNLHDRGMALDGTWTFDEGGVNGESPSIGRFDTGYLVGPGTSVTATLRSNGARWSGGFEIFEDDLHWTYIAISPCQHGVDIQRFPAGTVNTVFVGSALSPSKALRLTLTMTQDTLKISGEFIPEAEMEIHIGDITGGRLFFRVGSGGDETHAPSGGHCRFTKLEVRGSPSFIPSVLAEEVPEEERPEAVYTLTCDNIDDQIDVLLDGRRLGSADYREQIGPLTLNPFLSRGTHTLMARVFNRKWTAAYGILLREDDGVVWDERCGDVRKIDSGCEAIGSRLGMVKELSYTFEVSGRGLIERRPLSTQ